MIKLLKSRRLQLLKSWRVKILKIRRLKLRKSRRLPCPRHRRTRTPQLTLPQSLRIRPRTTLSLSQLTMRTNSVRVLHRLVQRVPSMIIAEKNTARVQDRRNPSKSPSRLFMFRWYGFQDSRTPCPGINLTSSTLVPGALCPCHRTLWMLMLKLTSSTLKLISRTFTLSNNMLPLSMLPLRAVLLLPSVLSTFPLLSMLSMFLLSVTSQPLCLRADRGRQPESTPYTVPKLCSVSTARSSTVTSITTIITTTITREVTKVLTRTECATTTTARGLDVHLLVRRLVTNRTSAVRMAAGVTAAPTVTANSVVPTRATTVAATTTRTDVAWLQFPKRLINNTATTTSTADTTLRTSSTDLQAKPAVLVLALRGLALEPIRARTASTRTSTRALTPRATDTTRATAACAASATAPSSLTCTACTPKAWESLAGSLRSWETTWPNSA